MLMIERLQREKAAAQMKARQFRRYAEGRADREHQVQEELASLSDLAASYHSRLRSHGINPDSFSDEEEGEEVEQIDVSDPSAERDAGDASAGMEVKAVVVDEDNKEGQDEDPSSPVEKEFEYTVDVPCTTKAVGAVVVTEYVGDGNAGGIVREGGGAGGGQGGHAEGACGAAGREGAAGDGKGDGAAVVLGDGY
jgi:hypothetical protein